MRNIEVIAAALATALKANGDTALTNDQLNAAAREAVKASTPDDAVDNMQAITANTSALNQALERAGLIKRDRQDTAMIAAIRRHRQALG